MEDDFSLQNLSNYEPEYFITIMGSAIWTEAAPIETYLKILLSDPAVENTILGKLNTSHENSGRETIAHLLARLRNISNIIYVSKEYIQLRADQKNEQLQFPTDIEE